MHAERRTLARATCRVLTECVTWILAGGGWGLLLGGALEATLGSGPDGLFDAAGAASLVATAGAVLGSFGMALLLMCSGGLGCIIGAFLTSQGFLAGLRSRPVHGPGLWHEISIGALGCAGAGAAVGAYFGAGWALTLTYGEQWGHPFVLWATALGFGAGAARGVFVAARTVRGALAAL